MGKWRKDPFSEDCCVLCRVSDDDPDQFGEKITLKEEKLTIHYFCLLTASGVYQRGEEKDGVFGFLVDDIRQEIRRCSRLRCGCCRRKGAAVGCCVKSCRKMVHFPCGRKQCFIFQFTDLFKSYCLDHSPKQTTVVSEVSLPEYCSVCLDSIEPLLSYSILKCPACHTSWFHRSCVQRQAQSAGLHFFRCTLCNNKDSFQQEMLRMGIYIPDRDASWELEANAFSELLQVYQRCDAPNCSCRNGRSHSSKTGWFEVLRCRLCGSKGTHRKCSDLSRDTSDWACLDCTQAVDGKASLGVSPLDGSPRKSRLSKQRLSSISSKRSLFSGGSPSELLQSLALQLSPLLPTQISPLQSPQLFPQTPSPPSSHVAGLSLVQVSGEDALSAGLELVRRPDFDPSSRLSVRFKDKLRIPSSLSSGESATRYFLKLLVQQIQNCAVFEGPDGNKNLALDSQALREDLYFDVGCLLAVSLLQGGPPPLFFSAALYQCLFNFPRDTPLTISHMTSNTHFTRKLCTIVEAQTLEDLKEAIADNWEYLELAGCHRPICKLEEREALVEDMVSFSLITRMQLPLQRFREGLKTLGVFEQVQLYPSVFCETFCGPAEPLRAQSLGQLFSIQHRKLDATPGDGEDVQIPALSYWRQFLLECEVGRSSVSLQDLLRFATGAEEVPAVGFYPSPSLSFLPPLSLPADEEQETGERWREKGLFPQSQPSSNLLHLPPSSSYKSFKSCMEQAVSHHTHLLFT